MATNRGLKSLLLFFLIFIPPCLAAQHAVPFEIPLREGEKVWAGVINHGDRMPVDSGYEIDLIGNNYGNQTQPLLLTNMGRYVWSDGAFRFAVSEGVISIYDNRDSIVTGIAGATLAEAHSAAVRMFFPGSGRTPDLLFFSAPQYNTWIELLYNHNEEDILKYAQTIIDNGFPPGVLMIDDTWQEDYGVWDFHPGRFRDPKGMVDKLHRMGFKVMLWICPFVSPDQYLICKEIMAGKGFLLSGTDGAETWEEAEKPYIAEWWNGYSAVIDFSNPCGEAWFRKQLDRLVAKYGIDGFKFDAGDAVFYTGDILSKGNVSPTGQSELFARIGLDYPFNEYRACWKMGGEPLVQRLRDKRHTWGDLQVLIPDMAVQNLMGYVYSCPDLIAGGEHSSFSDKTKLDQELTVRSTQCQALMTMMQFSVAPWNILDEEHLSAVKKAVGIRGRFTPLILALAERSRLTGEPVIKNMEYVFPHRGLLEIKDQFMLGEKLLVAPMVYPGSEREVALPEGRWKADDGKVYRGGKTYRIFVPLDRIPYFELTD